MSVDTKAGFFYGWKFTDEERQMMVTDYYNKFGNYDIEDCFEVINGYDPYYWLFGTWVSYFPDAGLVRAFDYEMMGVDHEAFMEEYGGYLRDAGRSDIVLNVQPKLWCAHIIY